MNRNLQIKKGFSFVERKRWWLRSAFSVLFIWCFFITDKVEEESRLCKSFEQRLNSWTVFLVEVSEHKLESYQNLVLAWVFYTNFSVLQKAIHELTRVFLFRGFFVRICEGLWIAWRLGAKDSSLLLNWYPRIPSQVSFTDTCQQVGHWVVVMTHEKLKVYFSYTGLNTFFILGSRGITDHMDSRLPSYGGMTMAAIVRIMIVSLGR